MTRPVSIGFFAKAVRLSIKALRRYDAEGLLRPAVVDPDTGYRYYTPEQSRDAVTISMLRTLDVPVATIRTLLEADQNQRTAILEGERTRLARELVVRQAALASVEHLLQSQTLLPHSVRQVEMPVRRVATLGFATDGIRMEHDTTEAIRRLLGTLRAEALDFDEPVGCHLFEADDAGRRSLVVYVGLAEGTPRSSNVRVETMPAGRAAATKHVGPYTQLGLAHFALHAWTNERGLKSRGPVIELYVNDPDEVDPNDLVTELRLPLAD